MNSLTYDRYRSAVAGEALPLAYLDREALNANIETTRQRADGLPVRVASKSVRCRAVLEYILKQSGFRGIMCYTGREAAHLASYGFEDLLVAYPVWHAAEIEAVCKAIDSGTHIVLTVDADDHVNRIADIAADHGVEVPLCLDVDMSTTHLGVHFGVRRSGIQTTEAALTLARSISDQDGVTLTGVMGYEAQIAGLSDDDPSNDPVTNAVIRRLKRRSIPRFRERRGAIINALERAGYELSFVNGGGTGSVESTRDDEAVTELTVGSGFYAPHQFDHYREFQYEPAMGYAIEIARQPTADVYTCRGGGYAASGPSGDGTTPIPHLPPRASLLDREGAGEVQTPIRYDGSIDLSLGDPVFFRHAKAGEPCAHFERLCVVDDDEIVARHPTYRGDGRCFV